MAAKKAALLFGGLTVYATATIGTYIYMYDPDKGNAKPITGNERQARFDKNSAEYDKEIDWDETMTGIKLMRRFLLKNATGSVLEVAAGTGRNVAYYPPSTQVHLTDLSASMLKQIPNLPSNFRASIMSAEEMNESDDVYDTVVDTFALCSVDNPVQMLQEMQRVCKSDGKILLLEHGKSHYSWLTYVLDKFALKHAERWGCFWNRDILQIVADAGLQVESLHRFHFGTTYYIVAKPKAKDYPDDWFIWHFDMAGVGVLVCLEVPVGSEFGVDYEAFRTADKFRGVKLIPSGLHFVFYASNGENDNGNGIRQGFFIDMQPNDVLVRKWSSDTEELVPMKNEADVENLTRAVQNFQLDANLGAYPQKHSKTWQRLSKYITKDVLHKCGLTIGGTITPGDPDVMSIDTSEAVKPFFPDTAQTARFTSLKKSTSGKSAHELTMYHVDSSEHLEWLIRSEYKGDWKLLLGELQLSFVLFLLISSFDALNQWKQFVWLLCTCEAAVATKPDLFIAFLQLIHVHMEQVGNDFFQDEVANENFIKASLASLFEILNDDTLDPKLLQRSLKLKMFLKDRFQLQFDVMGTYCFGDDDSAPAVVMPDELPSYVFTQDTTDTDEGNIEIAKAIHNVQQQSC